LIAACVLAGQGGAAEAGGSGQGQDRLRELRGAQVVQHYGEQEQQLSSLSYWV